MEALSAEDGTSRGLGAGSGAAGQLGNCRWQRTWGGGPNRTIKHRVSLRPVCRSAAFGGGRTLHQGANGAELDPTRPPLQASRGDSPSRERH